MRTHPDAPARAAALIAERQKVRLEAALDGQGVPVIGCGLRRYDDGSPVRLGDICQERIAVAYLQRRLEQDLLPGLADLPGWPCLGAARQAALLSLAWRLGLPQRATAQAQRAQWAPWLKAMTDGARTGAVGALQLGEGASAVALELATWAEEDVAPWSIEALRNTWKRKALLPLDQLSRKGRQLAAPGERLRLRGQQPAEEPGWAWASLADGERWLLRQADWLVVSEVAAAPLPPEIDWMDLRQPVGPEWTVADVLQHDARCRPVPGSAAASELRQLLAALGEMRLAWGGPLGLCGGYRPAPYGTELDGERVSGRALDLYPTDGELNRLVEWLLRRWHGGLAVHKAGGFLRVSLEAGGGGGFQRRPGPRRCTLSRLG